MNRNSMKTERRQFNRVAFRAPATLSINGEMVKCEILDLCLHGVLLSLIDQSSLDLDSISQLTIPLDEEHIISMEIKLTHQNGSELGFECQHIDLDSITHLRRLVELNLGDSKLLEREFSVLIQS